MHPEPFAIVFQQFALKTRFGNPRICTLASDRNVPRWHLAVLIAVGFELLAELVGAHSECKHSLMGFFSKEGIARSFIFTSHTSSYSNMDVSERKYYKGVACIDTM